MPYFNASTDRAQASHLDYVDGGSDWLRSSWKDPLIYPTGSMHFLRSIPQHTGTERRDSHQEGQEEFFRRAPLDIVVAGAGIGGLAAAIALKLKGHNVTVLEQSKILNEIGAGIQIPPNATRLLERWGVMPHLLKHVLQPHYWAIRRWQDGSVIGMTDKTRFKAEFGAEYYVAHRAHYHQALHDRAHELGIDIVLDSRIEAYHENVGNGKAGVRLVSGSIVEGDLVVGADGVKGISRSAVNGGTKLSPMNTGYVAYRANVDAKRMRQEPDLRSLIEKPCLQAWMGPSQHVVTYEIQNREGLVYNIVFCVPDDTDEITVVNKNEIEELRRHAKGWDPRILKLLDMTDTALKWPTLVVPHVERWVSPAGTIAIIGDAAHGMLPFMAQGAAMAVEDAAALAEAVDFQSGSQVDRLKVYERIRKERSGGMQQASNMQANIWHIEDGPAQKARDAAMRAEVEGRRQTYSPNQFSDPSTSLWAYGYDAEVETQTALKHRLGAPVYSWKF